MEKISTVEEKKKHTTGSVTPVSISAASLVKIDSISINLGKVMDKKVTEKCHHFSIRRYAAEMREKDIRKCAPFVCDDDDESKLRQQLVPLHVPEFRWWRCESCVQEISVASASQSLQIVEKATSSLSIGEIHASTCGNKEKDDALSRDEIHSLACGNKEKDDALIGLTAVAGHENSVKDVSNQKTGEQTLSLATCPPCQIPEKHTDGTVGEESTGKELTNVCVPEPGSNVAASDVLAKEYPRQKSSSSGDVCPAEKTDGLNKDTRNLVVTNEASKKDVDMDTSRSAKEAGAVEQPYVELQKKQVESTATASCTRRRKKVRLIAELLNVNGEEKSDQLVSNKAMLKEVALPASTSGQRKRKITQEPSKGIKLPSREAKKARKYKGDAKTTIATIHISDSDSEEDGASAGTGFRSPMPLQQTENGPCSSKLNSYKSIPSGIFKDDVGLDLSLNSYMEVDKVNTPVPQEKTVLNNDLWRKEGNCIGQSSAPNLSFTEDIAGDISGKNASNSEMMHQQEISLSPHKKLDLSLGCNNKKTNEPERFSDVRRKKTDQRSETVFEQRSNDEIPMDIVELMAMHQYERGLPETERNFCPAKRIDERNPEVMGFSDGHGNGVRSMQKEHERWNPVLSQNNNNQFVLGNRDESYVVPTFGTQNSASRTLTSSDTRNRLWSGEKLVHRSSQTDTQVSDTYNTAHDGPQSSEMAKKFWAGGAASIAHPKLNFPQKLARQTSYMHTGLPSLDFHKGKTIRDLDLNRADPNDSDLGVLLPCPFVANNTGGESNRKEMELLQNSYSNEAIPAMQLLSLMDAGTQSPHPFSVDGKKVIEKPFFPCNNHRDLSMDQRANLFEKPFFPQNHQVKKYSGSETAIYKSSASTRPMPSALLGQDIVKSQRPEKAKKASLLQQTKDWRSRTTVGPSGVPDMIRDCNPGQDKQKGILGASAEVVFPVERNAPKVTENQKNLSSCHIDGTIMPLKDMSKEEVCIVSRNPADFSIPDAGNIYMIGSGDLKFSKDFSCRYRGFNGQRRH